MDITSKTHKFEMFTLNDLSLAIEKQITTNAKIFVTKIEIILHKIHSQTYHIKI